MTRLFRLSAGTAAVLPPGVFESLRGGKLLICPTDTLYGLAADPASQSAVARLVAAKGREGGKPIPLLLDGRERAGSLAREVPEDAARLMERFWPGALTIVLPASPGLPEAVTGGTGTVGLRVPGHPVPRALAAAVGGAITGTSANRAGSSGAWRTSGEILAEFAGEVDWILWDGPAPGRPGNNASGSPPPPGSTVVLAGEGKVLLLREGAIPFRTITEFLGKG